MEGILTLKFSAAVEIEGIEELPKTWDLFFRGAEGGKKNPSVNSIAAVDG